MTLLEQIKSRRIALKLKQKDMYMRIGISRQQYQQVESKGNPRLDTLALIAQGLDSELMLIPNQKRQAVLSLLSEQNLETLNNQNIVDNPWQGVFDDDLMELDE